MIVIAENLNTRNNDYIEALKRNDLDSIVKMAGVLIGKGADVINLQTSLDGTGDENRLPHIVKAISEAHNITISIDTRNTEALKKSIVHCKKPPFINYLSLEEEKPEEILSLCREYKCNLIIRTLRGVIPTSLEGKLQCIEDLIEIANAADIPNGRLYADPSVVHLGRGMGQDHLVSCRDFIATLKELVDPPINTIAWISNISVGISKRLKSWLNCSFLVYLAGAGLDAAILDVLDTEVMKTVYIIKAFRDEVVFSQADLEG
jgi:cobalamin-dependent methionine synthase I